MKRSISKWLVLFAASAAVPLAAFACGDLDEYYSHGNGNAPDTGTNEADAGGGRFTRHTRGSAIDVSEDDSRVVVVNRDIGSITVFEAKYGVTGDDALRPVKEVRKVCTDNSEGDLGEPWQVVLSPGGDTAYVVCRSAQVVAEVVGIKSDDPRPSGVRVKVGSEPTGIALTPRGTSAWVANWVDGTVQRIDLASMAVTETVDLNAALAGKYLGGVEARLALAHPRSVAITNDGDDDESDESVLVTEYFSQQKTELGSGGENADIARVGILYRISLSKPTVVTPIELPAGELRFLDANNEKTYCFPNQLQSVTINGSAANKSIFAYITSVCASPKGPIGIYSPTSQPVTCQTNANCLASSKCDTATGKCTESTNGVRTTTTPAITVIDLISNQPVISATIALNAQYWEFYESENKFPASSPERRLPLLANDVAFLPDTKFRAVVSAGGADALFRLTFNQVYNQAPVKTTGPGPFVDLPLSSPVGPIGVVVAHGHSHAFVANDGAREVAMVDLDAAGGLGEMIAHAEATSPADPNSDLGRIAKGKRLFNFGLSRWSMNQQGWGACSVCHVDGLTDNVTWFFPRGPRQTSSIDAFFGRQQGQTTQRNFGWNAALDEASDLDNNVLRNMFGGVGAIAKLPGATLEMSDRVDLTRDRGLAGSSFKVPENQLEDWKNIVEFLRSLRTPHRPTILDPAHPERGGLDSEQIKRGAAVAQNANCGGCHGGPLWTVSTLFYQPQRGDPDAGPDAAPTTNEKLRTTKWDAGSLPFDVLPTTDESARTMRYAGDAGGAFDSLTCALRNVGTFGTAEQGVGVAERRENMLTVAQGSGMVSGDVHEPRGYNPPSLLGLAIGAPYFHAGNARTLEAVFSPKFALHHGALKGGASFSLSEQERKDLIVYLLAIDRSGDENAAKVLDVPPGYSLCAPPP